MRALFERVGSVQGYLGTKDVRQRRTLLKSELSDQTLTLKLVPVLSSLEERVLATVVLWELLNVKKAMDVGD